MTNSLDSKVNDDNDYIFVDIDDEKELCNESFDYCDDELSELSQTPSLFESVCSETMFTRCSSEVTLEQFNGIASITSLEEDTEKNGTEISSVASLEEEQSIKDPSQKEMEINHNETELTQASKAKYSPRKPGKNQVESLKSMNRSRMSNKKRRKKMKLLEQATATAATFSERQNIFEHVLVAANSSSLRQRKVRYRGSNNATRVCVAESLATCQKQHNFLQKKATHSLNYVQLL